MKLVCITATAAGQMDSWTNGQLWDWTATNCIQHRADIWWLAPRSLSAALTYINTLSHKSQFPMLEMRKRKAYILNVCTGFCWRCGDGRRIACG